MYVEGSWQKLKFWSIFFSGLIRISIDSIKRLTLVEFEMKSQPAQWGGMIFLKFPIFFQVQIKAIQLQ